MRQLGFVQEFDGVLCWGNSFGYMEDNENRAFLIALGRARIQARRTIGARYKLGWLKQYSRLSNHVFEHELDGMFYLGDAKYDARTSRLNLHHTFIKGDRVEQGEGVLYAAAELVRMLEAAGLRMIAIGRHPKWSAIRNRPSTLVDRCYHGLTS